MFLLLAACIAPTTLGFHQDALVPAGGGVELGVGVGGMIPAADFPEVEDADVETARVSVGLGKGVGVDAAVSMFGGGALPRADVRAQLLGRDGEPFALAVNAGGSAAVFDDAGPPWAGGQLGVVGSYAVVETVRPYLGVGVSGTLVEGQVYPFLDLGLGATWRPQLTDQLSLLVLGEADYVAAFGQGDEVLEGVGGSVMAGLTWSPR